MRARLAGAAAGARGVVARRGDEEAVVASARIARRRRAGWRPVRAWAVARRTTAWRRASVVVKYERRAQLGFDEEAIDQPSRGGLPARRHPACRHSSKTCGPKASRFSRPTLKLVMKAIHVDENNHRHAMINSPSDGRLA